ncbi:MAG: flagellar basal-body rod protein FlgF [Rhizomicrobium sp.]
MLGAIYTSLSGMDAYTKGLQTISNNVANLNSNGYKQTTLAFSNLVDDSGSSFLGSGWRDNGSGVHIASTLTDFSQGQLQTTNNDLDLALQGSGFLVVLNKDGNTFYSRTGSFAVDKDGYISDQATGERLAVLDAGGHPVAINLNDKKVSEPAATTKIAFSDNLSSDVNAPPATVSNITVTDSRGGQHVWTATFTKSTDIGVTDQWDVAFTDSTGADVGSATLKFIGNDIDPTTQTATLDYAPDGADPMTVTLDFSGVTSQSQGTTSTIQTASVDGNAVGTLSTVTIDENGHILLTYTNQKTETEGAVAIANFRNPQLLTRLSNGLYQNGTTETPTLAASNTDGMGTLTPKSIESSNVDLSAEFGDLILLQRGFQACSEVISVSNDMIQQLFSIRGQ